MQELEALSYVYVLFFVMISLEMTVSLLRRDGRYTIADAATSIIHGMGFQASEILTKTLTTLPYLYVASKVVDWHRDPSAPWTWAVAFTLYELGYYWYHRHQHEVGLMWAIHAPHHSSEEYNLSTALRQSVFTGVLKWLYFLPIALAGVPFSVFVGCVIADLSYEFLIHTRYVPKLGFLEGILNTPSAHRVHHGRDLKYLDRNYGAITVLFDRVFGTYQAEQEEPQYGLTKPVRSFDYWETTMHVYRELARVSRTTARWQDKLRVWFAPPGWYPQDMGGPKPPDPPGPNDLKHSVSVSLPVFSYLGVQSLMVSGALGALILSGDAWPSVMKALLVASIFWTLFNASGLIQGRRWAALSESVRVVATVLVLAWVPQSPSGSRALPAALPVLSVSQAASLLR